MPHSSGGGSSGGGFHGGSYGHSSSGTTKTIRTSDTFFQGARAFVYYRGGSPRFFYTDSDPMESRKEHITAVVMISVFLALSMLLIFAFVNNPKKLQGTDGYEIYVDDAQGILGDTSELEKVLAGFKAESGITPAIATVPFDDWTKDFSDLESYAYYRYINEFSDETHWLIVYSENYADGKARWYWEGMQGNDTDDILTEKKTTQFGKKLQKSLKGDELSVNESITDAFKTISDGLMKKSVNWPAVIFWAVFAGLLTFGLIACIKGNKARFKKGELVEITENPESPATAECEYCGGTYVTGLHSRCPHCSAVLPLTLDQINASGNQ